MNFDYIVYLDSDIVINNPHITIESIIDGIYDIFAKRNNLKINT